MNYFSLKKNSIRLYFLMKYFLYYYFFFSNHTKQSTEVNQKCLEYSFKFSIKSCFLLVPLFPDRRKFLLKFSYPTAVEKICLTKSLIKLSQIIEERFVQKMSMNKTYKHVLKSH